MNKINYILIASLFFLASCSENDSITPNIDSADGVPCKVGLSVASMEGDISTRSTEIGTVDEDLVTGLWALQFEDASTGGSGALLKKYYVAVDDPSKIDILLKANATGRKSNIYFVANVNKTNLDAFSGNETAFKSAVQKVTSEQGFILSNEDPNQTQKCIPMSGSLLGQTVTTAGIYGGINVRLVRMLARIDFQYSVGPLAAGKFSLKTVQARNFVNKMAYLRQETSTYPQTISLEDVLCLDPEAATVGTIIPGSSPEIRQLTFYVPENIRGNGNNISGLDKMKSGVPYATYFELYGEGLGPYSGEKFLIRLYPGSDTQNNYSVKRNTRYVLAANLANLSLSDRRITKVGSNCYIVKPGESVTIPISRANESLLDLQIPDVYNSGCTASVYWETGTIAEGVVTLSKTDCSDGTFTVNGVGKGNAVVCIKNALNEIMWSWHIWVSDVDFKTSNTITTINTSVTPNAEYVWMDRNLGAVDLPGPDKTFATTAGLFYQWGRKDPFVSILSSEPFVPVSLVSLNAIYASYFNVSSTLPYVYQTSSPHYKYTDLGTLINKQLFYSVKAPALLINDWKGSMFSNASTEENASSDSWGAMYGQRKTVYDPCPQGWRVPSPRKSSAVFSSPWKGVSFGSATTVVNGSYINTPNFGVYPMAGVIQAGFFNGVNSLSYNWMASTNAFYVHSLFENVEEARFCYPFNYYPVRCVKE